MKEYKFMQRRMMEGFIFLYIPVMLITFFIYPSIKGVWCSLVAMNVYRCVSSAYRVKTWNAPIEGEEVLRVG